MRKCDLKGLYLAGDRQLLDYHLDVAHGVPQCTSRETYKGILYGRGRAVLDGRVLVALDAQKSDAHLSNKNLLLSREAEVDTKHQLEILADDVRCSHGTTVGQIEPELLFYLRARGIPAPLARRMLCLGFAEEIIDAQPMPPRLRSLQCHTKGSITSAPGVKRSGVMSSGLRPDLMPSRAAISSLSIPLAAIRIILARTTSKYGNVYLTARRLSSADSSGDNSMQNGLFLGMRNPSSKDRTTMPYVAKLIKTIRGHIYKNAY